MFSNRLRLVAVWVALAATLSVTFWERSSWTLSRNAPQRAAALEGNLAAPDAAVGPATCIPVDAKPSAKFANAVAERAQREDALAKIAAFTDWFTAWRRTDPAAQPALVAAGHARAVARRGGLKYLMQTDPRRALELAVPAGLRAELPDDVQAQLERRIDARGELEVAITHRGAEARYDRAVVVDGNRYNAFVFGRRETQPTKIGLPLHGIAVDDVMALSEMPYRQFDDTEKSRLGIAADRIGVTVGVEVQIVASQAELDILADGLMAAESAEGPNVGAKASESPAPPSTAALTSTPAWIAGEKRVLWVQVDFSDDPGAVGTVAEISATSATVSDFYLANSQGKTTMAFTVLPAVLRLPRPKAYYNLSSSTVSELQDNASVLAKQYDAANGNAGTYDPDRYDRWIVLFNRVPAYTFGGQALLGGARVRLNNNILSGTTGHELGHTQSLDHSHYWLPAGSSAVGSGAHVEYGDVFDIMGSSGSSSNNHFNVAQKAKLGYLDATSITTVTQPGTYRINRHDHRDASGQRALKIAPAELKYEYWVEHRRFGPTAFNSAQLDRLRNGVLLHWGPTKAPKFTTGAGSYLVDGTPGSAGGANDAAVRIGETFTDPDAGLTIKPLAVGGTAPNEYIDVQVAFGAIDGNRNPSLQAEVPAGTLTARSNIIFTANATDPDGDPVYFRWDFGDSTVQPILNNITRRFTKGGTYSLRVSAHDGKGGIAAKTLSLEVADPLLAWTRQGAGVATTSLNDVVFAGGQFMAGGTGLILTSPDGMTWTRRDAGTTAHGWLSIAHNGARYVGVGARVNSATDRGGAVYSDDGITWTLATVPTGTGQMYSVTYGAGRFVAVGEQGQIYNSIDGLTWTNVTSPVSSGLRSIAYADSLFVISGDSGRILTSNDGVNWTNRSVPTGNTLGAVTRHNNAWYASSATVECFTSSDTVTWTRTATTGRTNAIVKLISTGGLLFAPTANGSIAFTEDPRAWVTHQIDATANTTLAGAAEGNGVLVVVGSRGLIYTAAAPVPNSTLIAAPVLRNDADSLKVSVGRKNVLAASGAGFAKLELYANGTKVSELNGSAGALSWTPAAVGNYSLVVRGINAAGESVVSAEVPAQSGLAGWNWRNPSPVGTDLNGAVRVGNKWWIIGRCGTLLTLDSAGTLTPVDFPTTQWLTGIAYANGRFVVSATYTDFASREDIGALWTSTDGYAWTPLLTEISNNYNLNFVTYGDRWLAGSTGGTILTSTDGLVWTRQLSGVAASLQRATFGNGLWVAVGAGGKIITSPDAVRWTERASGVATDLWGVAYNNGVYVAVGLSGTILRSVDGATWTRATSPTTSSLFFVNAWNGSLLAVGNSGSALISTDGTTWTQVSLGGKFSDIFCAAGSGDEGLLVGRAGEIYSGSAPSAWQRATRGTGEARFNVIYAGGRFVAVGQTTDAITRAVGVPVSISTDGITWTRANANSAFANLNDVTYGQQRYVAVGDNSRVFTSTDGVTWTQSTFSITSTLTAVAAGPDAFVAASSGAALYSSPDGATWTQRGTSLGTAFRAAAYGNGRYVVVGDGGGIFQSADGITWTAATSGVTASLQAIGWWENSGFIAVGNSGTMIGSIDGVTWQLLESGVADNLTAIALTPIGFVAAGGTNGTSLISLDGANWSISPIPSDHVIRGIAASPSAIVAVGDNGTMLTFELANNAPPPLIIAQPASTTSVPGAAASFSVSAQNTSGAVFQWLKDGVPILGANSPVYSIPVVTGARTGSYTVSITTGTGTIMSAPATLGLAAVTDPGRLVNLSILTTLTSRDDNFTFGVVVGGSGTSGVKPLLVRAVGPSLTALGVTGVLDDPKLEFFTGSTKVGENDNWGGAVATAAVMAQVGAFPFSGPTSRDAAISLPSLASGANSARISGTGAGAVIAELYDATPSSQFSAATPRLVNVSVLKHLGTGVTAGFVIGGSTSRTVLIRAIGPTLGAAPFNVGGVVADPQLALFSGQTQIAANDNWGGTSALTAAFAQLAAFSLPPGSKDAALLAELRPGNYTVQVSGVGGTTGVALVEVYEVP